MGNTSLKRTILFEVLGDTRDIVFDYKFAMQNYGLHRRILENKNQLVRQLKIEDIVNVKPLILDSAENCDSNLRLYIYKAKNCNTGSIQTKDFSHALQVSLGNGEDRSDWVAADEEFSAKVFPGNEKKLIFLIEDIVLDIQMFYYFGYDKSVVELHLKREFSKQKVDFLIGKKMKSYLGSIIDSDYVSFASFCRMDNGKLDFDLYVDLWKEFNIFIKNNKAIMTLASKHIYSSKDIKNILKEHPKGGQLSLNKIQRLLCSKPEGKYILIRTEKKPKYFRQRRIIENRFGMAEKWKTGKLKIVDYKYRYTFQKMEPYVSLYEFEWKG